MGSSVSDDSVHLVTQGGKELFAEVAWDRGVGACRSAYACKFSYCLESEGCVGLKAGEEISNQGDTTRGKASEAVVEFTGGVKGCLLRGAEEPNTGGAVM